MALLRALAMLGVVVGVIFIIGAIARRSGNWAAESTLYLVLGAALCIASAIVSWTLPDKEDEKQPHGFEVLPKQEQETKQGPDT